MRRSGAGQQDDAGAFTDQRHEADAAAAQAAGRRGQAGDPFLGDPRLFYAGNPVSDYQGLIDFASLIRNVWRAGAYTGGAQVWVRRCTSPSGVARSTGSPVPNSRNTARSLTASFKS